MKGIKSRLKKLDKEFSNVINTILIVTGSWIIAENLSRWIHTYIFHGTVLLMIIGLVMIIVAEERIRLDKKRRN